jgi:diguanylate cyclase (GGDEF)-like protein
MSARPPPAAAGSQRATASAEHIGRALLVISVVSIVMMTFGAFVVSYSILHQQTRTHLRTLMAVTVAESVAPLRFHDAIAAEEVLRAIPLQEGIALAEIRDSDDQVLAQVTNAGNTFDARLAQLIGAEHVRQDVVVGTQRIGSVILDGGGEPLAHMLTSLIAWCIAGMGIIGFASLMLARRYTRRITRPINELRNVMQHMIEHGDFSRRAPPSELSEVEDLRSEFNILLEEIAIRDRLLTQSNDALRRVAYIDALTNLPNRAMFDQALQSVSEDCLRTHTRACLLYLDVDGFKSVNDTFGHAAGDALLGEIGARLRAWHPAKAIAARLGGDEFVALIWPCSSADEAAALRDDLQAVLDRPLIVEGRRIHPGISMGHAMYPDMTADPARLIEMADRSMYDSKDRRYLQNRGTRWDEPAEDAMSANFREFP